MINNDIYKKLQKFCSNNDDQPKLSKPFVQHGDTYATNGHIAIRIPGEHSDIQYIKGKHPSAKGLFELSLVNDHTDSIILKKSDMSPYYRKYKCDNCNPNLMTEDHKCPECEGEGTVLFENDYNEYDFTCISCSGIGCKTVSGKIPTEICSCTFQWNQKDQTWFVGKLSFVNAGYLYALITTFGTIKVYPPEKAKDAVPITFDGGECRLMPLNNDDYTLIPINRKGK